MIPLLHGAIASCLECGCVYIIVDSYDPPLLWNPDLVERKAISILLQESGVEPDTLCFDRICSLHWDTCAGREAIHGR